MATRFNGMVLWVTLSCLQLNVKFVSLDSPNPNIRTKQKIVFQDGNSRLRLSSFHEIIANYSRIREYYRAGKNSEKMWDIGNYPGIVVANIIAESANATLITKLEAKEKWGFESYPEIRVTYTAIWARIQDHKNDSHHFIDKVPQGVRIAQILASGWNFLYADLTKQEKISVWDFRLFTDPLDVWTWLLLQTAYLFVVPLSGHFSGVIMPALAATLSFGTTGPPTKSKIFLLWMLTCMLFGNLYSGELTSKIMIPPKDEVMTEFRQLVERNYTMAMLFSGAINSSDALNVKIAQEFLAKRRSRTGKILKRLFDKAIYLDIRDIPKTLAFREGNFAVMGSWPSVHMILWRYNYLIQSHGKVKRKCHIGRELLKASEKFFIFLPPQSHILAEKFMKIQEAGIYKRWSVEENGLMHSMRVQDRLRVKSPTTILEIRNTQEDCQAQALEGKMITLFLLWGVCIVISWFGFITELIFKKFS